MDHQDRKQWLLENYQYLSAGYTKGFYSVIAHMWEHFYELVAQLQIEYGINPVIIGGLAVQHWGLERQTVDIDILLSRADYTKLEEAGKIKFGQLKLSKDAQIDVLCEGKDGNPNPETVRDGNTVYPTFEGLMYLKLLSGRTKDHSDIVELLKLNGLTDELLDKVMTFLPTDLRTSFEALWLTAVEEKSKSR